MTPETTEDLPMLACLYVRLDGTFFEDGSKTAAVFHKVDTAGTHWYGPYCLVNGRAIIAEISAADWAEIEAATTARATAWVGVIPLEQAD
jgi:hypothetical protein